MLEFRIRHWSQFASGLLARLLHSIFSIVKEQTKFRIADFQFRNQQFEIRGCSVELIGIEPTTSWLQTRRSPKLSYSPAADVRRTAVWA